MLYPHGQRLLRQVIAIRKERKMRRHGCTCSRDCHHEAPGISNDDRGGVRHHRRRCKNGATKFSAPRHRQPQGISPFCALQQRHCQMICLFMLYACQLLQGYSLQGSSMLAQRTRIAARTLVGYMCSTDTTQASKKHTRKPQKSRVNSTF